MKTQTKQNKQRPGWRALYRVSC